MSDVIGYLGTGHFAFYTIAALRKYGHEGRILLSPRNAETAARIAADHDCEIATSNQAVIDASDIVVLAVRPPQLDGLLDGLVFRDSQVVLSAIAGKTIAELRKAGALPENIVRFLPSSFIEFSEPFWPVYPANERVKKLLGVCGKVITFETEDQFDAALLASCSNCWIYAVLDDMTKWFVNHGLPEKTARELVARNTLGATANILANPRVLISTINNEIASEGTFSLAGLEMMRKAGAFAPWSGALDGLARKLGK
jgi:pyrroline-5-carboxylate reductase